MIAWELLAPLLKRWQTWVLIVIGALLLWALTLRRQLADARAALAARPAVHTEAEQQVHTVRVAGPVRVVTKTVYVPGTTQVQYVERDLERGPVTTTTQKDSEVQRDVRPACAPSDPEPWREVDAIVDPFAPSKLVGLAGSVTLKRRLVLGGGGRVDRGGEGHLTVGVRF